jgi:acetyl-CoA synthetase
MSWATITKTREWPVAPNVLDYEQVRAAFTWEAAERQLDGLPDGRGLNIAHEAVDRHALSSRRDQLALRWLGKHGGVRDFTYSDLRDLSNRFANVLFQLNVGAGDRVFILAGRIPELYISALGTLKNRSVPTRVSIAPARSPWSRPTTYAGWAHSSRTGRASTSSNTRRCRS